MNIRKANPADSLSVLALNLESERYLSPLSGARLKGLAMKSEAYWVVEQEAQVSAFLLAFREGVDYDSVNYNWFAERYSKFLYIDRIVVAHTAQAMGLGSKLYQAIFAHARATAVPIVVCEFDLIPKNPVSAGFHSRFGFGEVGKQVTANGGKLVSLQLANIIQP